MSKGLSSIIVLMPPHFLEVFWGLPSNSLFAKQWDGGYLRLQSSWLTTLAFERFGPVKLLRKKAVPSRGKTLKAGLGSFKELGNQAREQNQSKQKALIWCFFVKDVFHSALSGGRCQGREEEVPNHPDVQVGTPDPVMKSDKLETSETKNTKKPWVKRNKL